MKQQHQSCSIRQAAHKLKYRRPVEAGPKKLQSIKSWDTFAFLGCFPIHTGPTPPSPTNNVGRAYPECFFSEFQRCIGWGRENCKRISKRMHCFMRESRNDKKNMNITLLPQGLFSMIVVSDRTNIKHICCWN